MANRLRFHVSNSAAVGLALWTGAFALYLTTLAPSLSWGVGNLATDGGELLTAVHSLGVAHPPGYPSYLLLVKAFSLIVPFGDLAFRGNLFSAIMAATTVTLVFCLIMQVTSAGELRSARWVRIAGGTIGAASLGVAPLFWSQSTITEVYTLNTVFAGTLLLIGFRLAYAANDRTSSDVKQYLAFGIVFGLGLGNHVSIAAIAAPLLIWIALTRGWMRKESVWLLGGLALGTAVYAYLPIRAASDPAVNWGDASTMRGAVWMVTGRAYQGYLGIAPYSLPGRVTELASILFVQFNVLGAFLGLTGCRDLFAARRGFFSVTSFIFLIFSAYSILFNSIDHEVLFIPAITVFAVWVGVGSVAILRSAVCWLQACSGGSAEVIGSYVHRARSYSAVGLAGFFVVAVPGATAALNYEGMDLSNDYEAVTYARGILDSVPDNSVVFSGIDGRVFALWYVSEVEQPHRKMATIAVPLLQFDWYWDSIRQRFPAVVPEETPEAYTDAIRIIVEHNDGAAPVFFTYRDRYLYDSFEVSRTGNMYQVRPKPGRAAAMSSTVTSPTEISLVHSE